MKKILFIGLFGLVAICSLSGCQGNSYTDSNGVTVQKKDAHAYNPQSTH